jgi:hypothetical protein
MISFLLDFVIKTLVRGLLQVESGSCSEPPDQRLEFFEFSLFSHGGFLITYIRCLMKCVKWLELFMVRFWLS